MSIGYANLRAFGCQRAEFHLALMRSLTRIGFPVTRSRGLDVIARQLRRSLRAENCYVQVELTPDAKLVFPVYDSYWGSHVYRNMPYEPALARLFARVSRYRFAFMDCGANFGYWSAVITSQTFGAHECVAIESSPETFVGLQLTAALNNMRFSCINKAVWDGGAKKVVFLEGGRHAGRHVAERAVNAHPANAPRLFTPPEHPVDIETISIDEVGMLLAADSLLVKLDVEGSELRAIDGAGEVASRDSVFVYEDHGADREHRVSRGLLSRGFRVFFPTTLGEAEQIHDAVQLTNIKRSTHRGYNLLATRSDGPLVRAITSSG